MSCKKSCFKLCQTANHIDLQEVVREVQAFAEMRDDFTTDSDTESEMTYDFAEDGSVYSTFSPERCVYTLGKVIMSSLTL
jgi:hypothetical protein